MQRLKKIIPIMMLSMLTQACGGPEPVVMDRTADLSAPMSILEADLPGCEALTAEMVVGQDAKLLQHPLSNYLVVLVVGPNKPICVDTLEGVKTRLEIITGVPKGALLQGVLPENRDDEDEGEGEGEGGNKEDDGETGTDGKAPGPLKHSVTIQTKTLVSDDPIPIFLTSSSK